MLIPTGRRWRWPSSSGGGSANDLHALAVAQWRHGLLARHYGTKTVDGLRAGPALAGSNRAYWQIPSSACVALLREGPIAREAEGCEADQHHRPGRRLGNGAAQRAAQRDVVECEVVLEGGGVGVDNRQGYEPRRGGRPGLRKRKPSPRRRAWIERKGAAADLELQPCRADAIQGGGIGGKVVGRARRDVHALRQNRHAGRRRAVDDRHIVAGVRSEVVEATVIETVARRACPIPDGDRRFNETQPIADACIVGIAGGPS